MIRVVFVIPPGFAGVAAHHEGTANVGLLSLHAAPPAHTFLYPPHLVATCAAAVRAAGDDACVVDGSYAREPGEVAASVAQAAQGGPAIIACHISSGTAQADYSFLHMLRQRAPGAPVLAFGPSATGALQVWGDAAPYRAVLEGEPEAGIVEAVRRVAAGDLAGRVLAAVLAPGSYDGPLIRDLDSLSFPAWDLAPYSAYGAASMLSSRGCDAGCRFCAYVLTQGTTFRSQSVARTLAEWEWLKHTVQPPQVTFRDPVFAYDRNRSAAIAEGIADRGLQLPFAVESRPEHFDRELLRLLKAAGCTTIKIGVESGDPDALISLGRVRDRSQAEAYLADAARVARDCLVIGLHCRVFVMAGFPGAAPPAHAATLDFLRKLPAESIIHAAAYRTYPGTALQGAGQPVRPAMLEELQHANRRAPSLVDRARRTLRRVVPLRTSTTPAAIQPSPAREAPPKAPALPADWLRGRVVLLTGGNGFVGGHVARALCDAGARVIALVRPGSPPGPLDDLPVRLLEGDLLRTGPWLEALSRCEVCIHTAALFGGAGQAAEMYAVNTRGTIALLAASAAAGVRRFVYTGTIGTVGRPEGARTQLPDEDTRFNLWDRASHYVRSKYLGEQAALAWNRAGFEVVVVKPAAPVGAGDVRPSATGRRIAAALRGEALPYPAGGINFVPVSDVAAGHVLAVTRGNAGRSYILGHLRGNLDESDFLRMVTQAGGAVTLTGAGSRGALQDALTADPSRAVRELGMPQSDLAAAFREAVRYFAATHAALPAQESPQ